ncbi:MAG: DUF1330 domain-containing protein, partial [Zoogloea sp.]
MRKGYWIVHVDVTDQEQFKTYAAANAGALEKYGARFLARAGQFEVPEGTMNCPGFPRRSRSSKDTAAHIPSARAGRCYCACVSGCRTVRCN